MSGETYVSRRNSFNGLWDSTYKVISKGPKRVLLEYVSPFYRHGDRIYISREQFEQSENWKEVTL